MVHSAVGPRDMTKKGIAEEKCHNQRPDCMGRLAAGHLPGGPVCPPAKWAATFLAITVQLLACSLQSFVDFGDSYFG